MSKNLIIYGIPILVIVLSIPMVFGIIPPNRYYGLRLEKAYSSPELWYASNRIGGLYMLVAGIIALLMGTVLTRMDASRGLTLLLVMATILIGVFASLLHVRSL